MGSRVELSKNCANLWPTLLYFPQSKQAIREKAIARKKTLNSFSFFSAPLLRRIMEMDKGFELKQVNQFGTSIDKIKIPGPNLNKV